MTKTRCNEIVAHLVKCNTRDSIELRFKKAELVRKILEMQIEANKWK